MGNCSVTDFEEKNEKSNMEHPQKKFPSTGDIMLVNCQLIPTSQQYTFGESNNNSYFGAKIQTYLNQNEDVIKQILTNNSHGITCNTLK